MSEKSVLILVLHKIEVLDDLLHELNDAELCGATVLNSVGMAHELHTYEDSHAIGSLRALFLSDKSENRTVFMVIDNEKIPAAKEIVYRVVGDLSQPNTGILFALPVTFAEGLTGEG